ncbi:hypothetical protein ACFQV2_30580 [Actinokineospora soli]|uniref:Uncharacterized protein n=1 Tax=Actinokineospora soli TaxID=1048753 RepID=A0ABW2TTT2_9PSEU
MRASFATVPFYRELWALGGRTDPVLVPGRTGVDGGAVRPSALTGRVGDLVPLAGGSAEIDPLRGLGSVLGAHVPLRAGALVVVVDPATPRPRWTSRRACGRACSTRVGWAGRTRAWSTRWRTTCAAVSRSSPSAGTRTWTSSTPPCPRRTG